MSLTGHTTATLTDHLTGIVMRTETWDLLVQRDDRAGGGDIRLIRMQREGSNDDHDELVVIANTSNATYLWSSDPEYPFDLSGPNMMVFRELPNDICDLIETESGIDMEGARL